MKSKFLHSIIGASLCLSLALTMTGCGSLSESGSGAFASVKIKGHTPEEIAQVTEKVFKEDGYAGGFSGSKMLFQKGGSRLNTLAYEGAVATGYGAQTMIRIKGDIVGMEEGTYLLECQAYMVRGAGDSFFEEEQRLTYVRRGPYQSLLNKVAKQLK